MAVTVIVRTGTWSAEPPSLTFDGSRIVLGRGRECDVRLPDARVARRHTTVRPEKAGWALFDEGAPITPRVLVPATARTPAATLELTEDGRDYRVGPGAGVALALPESRQGGP